MNFKSQLCAAILTLGCSCLSANAMVANDAAKENKAQHYQPSAENLESRKQFQDDKFGIFLHWGLYSMLATGEWTMTNKDLNYKEYAKLAGGFYPSSLMLLYGWLPSRLQVPSTSAFPSPPRGILYVQDQVF